MRCAVNSLTTTTGAAPAWSRSSKPRPRTIGTPMVLKIAGVAADTGHTVDPGCCRSVSGVDSPRRSAAETKRHARRDRHRVDVRVLARLLQDAVDRAAHPPLVPLPGPEVQDRDAEPCHVDAGIVPRLLDRVLHEHRRDDEETGGDRDLPAEQQLLAPCLRRARPPAPAASSPRRSRERVSCSAGSSPKTTSDISRERRRDPERRGSRASAGSSSSSGHPSEASG